MSDIDVIITGASPDRFNRNSFMRKFVVEGFSQALSVDVVKECNLLAAPALIQTHKPKLVLGFGSCMPDDVDYSQVRYACNQAGAVLVFWLHDDPYEFDFNYKVIDCADYIFSNDRWAALHYDHPRTFHLPMAASSTFHWRPIQEQKAMDVFFCGVAFENRIRLVRDMKQVLARYNAKILGDGWPQDCQPICINQRLDNAELADAYAQSTVVLNMGRHFHYANKRYKLEPTTPGPRTFEAAMAGATQIYFVESLEIEDYYVPNQEILLFNSVAEFADIMAQVTAEPEKALRVGQAAQERTLRDHTYKQRAQSILQVINK